MSVTIGKLKVSGLFLAIFAVLYYFDRTAYLPMLLSCIFVHELGHICAIRICGGKIWQVEVLLTGVDIRTDGALTSYRADIFIYLAGALFNFIIAAAALIYMRMAGYSLELMFFLVTNLAYAIINLFPVSNLDGGKALCRLLEATMPGEQAYFMYHAISIAALVVLSIASIAVLVVTKYNISLALICIVLFYTLYRRRT